MKTTILTAVAALVGCNRAFAPLALLEGAPHFDHIVVIVDENKEYDQIVGGPDAPNLTRLAKAFGVAGGFYAEVHPGEANYVALLGGDIFGIHDDDPFYSRPAT